MTSYAVPQRLEPPVLEPGVVYTVASGDLRPAANMTCWPTQQRLEADLTAAIEKLGWTVRRGHPFEAEKGHGFIDSQRMGIDVFKELTDAEILSQAAAAAGVRGLRRPAGRRSADDPTGRRSHRTSPAAAVPLVPQDGGR